MVSGDFVRRLRERPDDGSMPLRKGVFLLPNLLTTCGLFAGFFSVIASVRGDYQQAAVAVLIANVFDILDGRVARLTNTSTRFGIEYDSLADVIAFGVAPGVLIYTWGLAQWGTMGWLAASTYVACGALRLARFNVQYETTEKRHFLGLPIPAAAEVIASTVLLHYYLGGDGEVTKRVTLLLVTYALAGLMVSSFKYFSFKEAPLLRRQPFWSLVAVVFVLTLVTAFPQAMLFLGFAGYAASAPARWLYVRGKRVYLLTTRSQRGGDRTSKAGAPEHSAGVDGHGKPPRNAA